jgi:hypothetical protein
MNFTTISEHSHLHASTGQVFSNLDGEIVILSLEDGVYYGLDPVGARIWALVQQPCTLRKLLEVLLAEFDVEPEVCRSETLALLENLAGRGLIEVEDAGSS